MLPAVKTADGHAAGRKAVLEKELEIIKKDVSVIPGQLSNKHKTDVVDALRSTFPLAMLLAARC
ncbi:hypothetical protein BKD83_04860 [Corynebacterium diphtheriae]|nr:hypothetical protein BKD83_04860 [Corynebacterium diphtheriae]